MQRAASDGCKVRMFWHRLRRSAPRHRPQCSVTPAHSYGPRRRAHRYWPRRRVMSPYGSSCSSCRKPWERATARVGRWQGVGAWWVQLTCTHC